MFTEFKVGDELEFIDGSYAQMYPEKYFVGMRGKLKYIDSINDEGHRLLTISVEQGVRHAFDYRWKLVKPRVREKSGFGKFMVKHDL